MSYPHTSLVILNYNGKSYLEKFLPGICQHTRPEIEIVVGDNASTDDSIDFLKNQYPTVKIIALDKNYGFAGGYNKVLEQVPADYYFLLNSDVELTMDWYPLIQTLQAHKDIAAIQPKILSQLNTSEFEHAGAAGGWIDSLGYPFCNGRIFNHVEKDLGQYNTDQEIFWASGAAMLVRADVFHQLGAFDSDYFAHMEEIDWCWRAKLCSWKIWYQHDVLVYHVGGGTLPYTSGTKVYLNFRNNLCTLIKNENAWSLSWILPVRLILDSMAAIQFILKRNFKAGSAIIRSYWHTLKQLSSIIKKRKQVQSLAQKHTFNTAGRYPGSIVFAYYVSGIKTMHQLIQMK